MSKYSQVGGRLGAYIRAHDPTTQQIQSLLADLLAGDALLPTMREVVRMPSFVGLRDLAGTGRGHAHRDSLLKEIERIYATEALSNVAELLSGILDIARTPQRESFSKTSQTKRQSNEQGTTTPEERISSLVAEAKSKQASIDRLQLKRDLLMVELEQSRNETARLKVTKRQLEEKTESAAIFFHAMLYVYAFFLIAIGFTLLANWNGAGLVLIFFASFIVVAASRKGFQGF